MGQGIVFCFESTASPAKNKKQNKSTLILHHNPPFSLVNHPVGGTMLTVTFLEIFHRQTSTWWRGPPEAAVQARGCLVVGVGWDGWRMGQLLRPSPKPWRGRFLGLEGPWCQIQTYGPWSVLVQDCYWVGSLDFNCLVEIKWVSTKPTESKHFLQRAQQQPRLDNHVFGDVA